MQHIKKLFNFNSKESNNIHSIDSPLSHSIIYGCDICFSVITNNFYKCFECEDYMICNNCWETKDIHPHPFIIMKEDFNTKIHYDKHIKSPSELLLSSAKLYNTLPCFGEYIQDIENNKLTKHCLWNENNSTLPWKWISYEQVMTYSIYLGLGLRSLDLLNDTNEQYRIGICANTHSNWVISSFGCCLVNLIWVGINPIITNQLLAHIIDNSGLSVLICENNIKFIKILQDTLTICKSTTLKYIIFLDDNYPNLNGNISCLSYYDMLNKGKESLNCSINEWKPYSVPLDKPMCLVYTSGSTGLPKGVIQTRSAWFFNIKRATRSPDPTRNVRFSFTPLAHSSGIRHIYMCFYRGGRVGFHHRSMDTILESIKTLKPLSLSGTPRFWEFLLDEFQNDLREALVVNNNLSNPKSEFEVKEQTYITFKQKLGGRITQTSVGGALSSKSIRDFMSNCFGYSTGDGFGITECGPVMNDGIPLPLVDVKLIDIPELGYYVNGNPSRGELCVKSPTVMPGYWNDKEKTINSFTKDGYYKTGDICEQYKDKYTVIGRLKFHFKLSSGEFLVPELLESIYSQSEFIHQIFIHGLPEYNTPVAIIIPSIKRALDWMKEYNINISFELLCDNMHFKQDIINDCIKISEEKNLMSHEKIKLILLSPIPFSNENNLLTASGKLNRLVLIHKFKDNIENILQSAVDEWNIFLKEKISEILNISYKDVDIGKSFKDIGDSLTAAKLGNLLKGKISSSCIQNLLKGYSISEALKYSKNQTINILDDCNLSLNITNILKNNKLKRSTDKKIIFLTGITGFIGVYLLLEILKRDNISNIICLVRNPDKVQEILDLYKIDISSYNNRILIIKGDISKCLFNLDNITYKNIQQKTTLIIHCAAWVNFYLSYYDLRDTNVIGTQNIIEFACNTENNENIPLCYISSNSVILNQSKNTIIYENNPLDSSNLVDNISHGYPSTKHVAELLVSQAGNLGLPIIIFRLGTIGGHSKTGSINPNDYLSRLLKSFIIVKACPFLNSSNESFMNIIPIDYCVKSIISICYKQLIDNNNNNNNRILYHISSPYNNLLFKDFGNIFENICDSYKNISFNEWKELINNNSNAKESLGLFIKSITNNINDMNKHIKFDNSNVISILGNDYTPKISEDIIKLWIHFLSKIIN